MSATSRSTLGYQGVCNGCPAARRRVFEPLVRGGKGACAFPSASLSSRGLIPARWFEQHAAAFIRRGILIRQRADDRGGVTSVDVAGPGTLVPLDTGEGPFELTGFAVSDALVCLYPKVLLDTVMDEGGPLVREMRALEFQANARCEAIAHARSHRDATRAVATLLVVISKTLEPPVEADTIPGDLQQRDIAGLLNLRHETVCRAFARLEAAGAIARDPSSTRILNRAMLEAA